MQRVEYELIHISHRKLVWHCTTLTAVGLPELILTAAWCMCISWERRQFVHDEKVQSPYRSAMAIGALTMNYLKARNKGSVIKKTGWKKPMENEVMVNVDGSFDPDLGMGVTGVVIRDHRGNCIAASCSRLSYVHDACMAEAHAMREGFLLAQFIGCNRIVLQSDCMQVIETMKEGGISATASAAIFDDCRVLSVGFDKVSFDHCPRNANKVAHELAKFSVSSNSICKAP